MFSVPDMNKKVNDGSCLRTQNLHIRIVIYPERMLKSTVKTIKNTTMHG